MDQYSIAPINQRVWEAYKESVERNDILSFVEKTLAALNDFWQHSKEMRIYTSSKQFRMIETDFLPPTFANVQEAHNFYVSTLLDGFARREESAFENAINILGATFSYNFQSWDRPGGALPPNNFSF